MGELVPEKRVDKNGVLTTKHVRPAPKSVIHNMPLPKVDDTDARALRMFDTIRNRRGKVSEAIIMEVQREAESRRLSIPEAGRTVLTLNPKTLDRLETPDHKLTDGIIATIRAGIHERSFIRLNNYAVLVHSLEHVDNVDAYLVIGGLNAHKDRSEWLDYSDATDSDLDAPRAVLRATVALDADFVENEKYSATPAKYISSINLVDLIEERPEDVDRIIVIVNERRPVLNEAGIDGIRETLDAGIHGAILNGTL